MDNGLNTPENPQEEQESTPKDTSDGEAEQKVEKENQKNSSQNKPEEESGVKDAGKGNVSKDDSTEKKGDEKQGPADELYLQKLREAGSRPENASLNSLMFDEIGKMNSDAVNNMLRGQRQMEDVNEMTDFYELFVRKVVPNRDPESAYNSFVSQLLNPLLVSPRLSEKEKKIINDFIEANPFKKGNQLSQEELVNRIEDLNERVGLRDKLYELRAHSEIDRYLPVDTRAVFEGVMDFSDKRFHPGGEYELIDIYGNIRPENFLIWTQVTAYERSSNSPDSEAGLLQIAIPRGYTQVSIMDLYNNPRYWRLIEGYDANGKPIIKTTINVPGQGEVKLDDIREKMLMGLWQDDLQHNGDAQYRGSKGALDKLVELLSGVFRNNTFMKDTSRLIDLLKGRVGGAKKVVDSLYFRLAFLENLDSNGHLKRVESNKFLQNLNARGMVDEKNGINEARSIEDVFFKAMTIQQLKAYVVGGVNWENVVTHSEKGADKTREQVEVLIGERILKTRVASPEEQSAFNTARGKDQTLTLQRFLGNAEISTRLAEVKDIFEYTDVFWGVREVRRPNGELDRYANGVVKTEKIEDFYDILFASGKTPQEAQAKRLAWIQNYRDAIARKFVDTFNSSSENGGVSQRMLDYLMRKNFKVDEGDDPILARFNIALENHMKELSSIDVKDALCSRLQVLGWDDRELSLFKNGEESDTERSANVEKRGADKKPEWTKDRFINLQDLALHMVYCFEDPFAKKKWKDDLLKDYAKKRKVERYTEEDYKKESKDDQKADHERYLKQAREKAYTRLNVFNKATVEASTSNVLRSALRQAAGVAYGTDATLSKYAEHFAEKRTRIFGSSAMNDTSCTGWDALFKMVWFGAYRYKQRGYNFQGNPWTIKQLKRLVPTFWEAMNGRYVDKNGRVQKGNLIDIIESNEELDLVVPAGMENTYATNTLPSSLATYNRMMGKGNIIETFLKSFRQENGQVIGKMEGLVDIKTNIEKHLKYGFDGGINMQWEKKSNLGYDIDFKFDSDDANKSTPNFAPEGSAEGKAETVQENFFGERVIDAGMYERGIYAKRKGSEMHRNVFAMELEMGLQAAKNTKLADGSPWISDDGVILIRKAISKMSDDIEINNTPRLRILGLNLDSMAARMEKRFKTHNPERVRITTPKFDEDEIRRILKYGGFPLRPWQFWRFLSTFFAIIFAGANESRKALSKIKWT